MRNTMIKKLLLNGGKWETTQGIPPLTLEKSLGKDLRDYKIYGNSFQDGTPTPDTPIEVESVGEYDETTGKYKIPIISSASGETIETNIYLDEPLRKIGDYADYIDFENGVVVRNIKRTELTGSAIRYNWNGRNGVYFLHMLDDNYNMNKNAVSNRCIHWTSHPAYDTNNIVMWLGMGNKVVYWVGILDCLGFTTTTELDNWLAENLTYVYYATNTPTETQMELPKLPTLKGTTVITVNTSVAPSNMLVRYKRKS